VLLEIMRIAALLVFPEGCGVQMEVKAKKSI